MGRSKSAVAKPRPKAVRKPAAALVFPDREAFLELAAKHRRIPLMRRYLSDSVTPIGLYESLRPGARPAFLLESGDGPEHATRFSFLGVGAGEVFGVDAEGRNFPDPAVAPFERIRRRQAESARVEAVGPFPGGAIGYLAYEAAGLFEKVPRPHPVPCPLMAFCEVDDFFVFDHHRHRLSAVVSVPVGKSAKQAYDQGLARLDALEHRLSAVGRRDPQPDPWFPKPPEPAACLAAFPREAFLRGVERLKEHIRAGDIFQGVLSCRYDLPNPAPEPWDLYRVMRATNPSPYMYHLRMGAVELSGTSPEALVTVRSGVAEIRPIAGTRPRGATREEDLRLEAELRADMKENAEHVMLVDLGRNDLGRVCKPGSVRVVDFKVIERYANVMHIVSSVRGTLAPGKDALAALVAGFPAGTVTGAPKIRAMEILAGLEPSARGVYAGAIVYAGDSGDLDSCIAIRTVVRHGKVTSVQAGAGVVYDSVPEREHEETLHKASAALRAAAGLVSRGRA